MVVEEGSGSGGGVEQWRERYLQSVEQLEEREKEWGELEALLRQYLSRLTFTADGSHRELERELKALRGALRNGTDSRELGPIMERVGSAIAALDRDTSDRVFPEQLLLNLLDALDLPRPLKRQAAACRRTLTQLGPGDDLRPAVQELSALLNEAVNGQAPKKGGLLDKLLHGESAGGYHQVPPLEQVLAPARKVVLLFIDRLLAARHADEANRLRERLDVLESEQALEDLAVEVARQLGLDEGLPPHEVLLQLLERLAIPAELTPQLESLKASLADGLPPERVESALGDIADLTTAMRVRVQSEKEELESFLQQLTANLLELDRNLRTSLDSQREAWQGGVSLDSVIQEQVSEIEHTVLGTPDVELLKRTVQQRVVTIREHMVTFRRTEDDRIRLAEKENRELRERLSRVEEEAQDLRGRVQEERRQALVDPLTGIPNRMAYNERSEQEYARWQRYGHPLVVSLWDVDRFKSINDGYGHQAGDKVLRVVAKLLSKQVRKTDFVARYGGEEFALLMPETTLDKALEVADKLRASVEKAEFRSHGQRVPVTISCGLAELRPGETLEQAFARADGAMYRAKDDGRNRCCKAE